MGKNDEKMSFEEALKELEIITDKLKSGDVSLEESLKLYESGIKYYKICSEILDDANQRILIYDKELNVLKEAE